MPKQRIAAVGQLRGANAIWSELSAPNESFSFFLLHEMLVLQKVPLA